MGSVVSLDDRRPHMAGEAKCLNCKSIWEAVAPIGTVELKCPECQTYKGVFIGLVEPEVVWECKCGNRHFYIEPECLSCARCGLSQEFEDA